MRSLSDGAIQCDLCQEALSARLDGEREPIPSGRVDEHVSACTRCSDWWLRIRDQAVTLRMGSSPLAPVLDVKLPKRRRSWWARLFAPSGRRGGPAALRLPDGARFGRRTGHLRPVEEPPA